MIMTLRTNAIIDDFRRMSSEDLDRIIVAAENELRERELEEQWKQDFDDLLAQQYETLFLADQFLVNQA